MKSTHLYEIANELASESPGFFDRKGAGLGNKCTNKFIRELGIRAIEAFGLDFSEQKICGDNKLAVDFYFADDRTIVEIALSLRNPDTEYEKDILKAIMAKSLEYKVEHLVFIAKPGGRKTCGQPGRQAIQKWLFETYDIRIDVWDLVEPK